MLGPASSLHAWLIDFARGRLDRGEGVFVVQFLSGRVPAPLLALASRSAGRLDVRAMGPDDPRPDTDSTSVDAKWATDGVALAARALRKGPWDQVVLLEVGAAVRRGLVELDRVLELFDVRPARRGLWLCCAEAPPELSDAADEIIRLSGGEGSPAPAR